MRDTAVGGVGGSLGLVEAYRCDIRNEYRVEFGGFRHARKFRVVLELIARPRVRVAPGRQMMTGKI
ncbi:hypothetical protein GCM10010520_12320 [Rhizobium viscosum]